MINSKACRIQSRRIRKGIVPWGEAISLIRSRGQRECIKKWPDGRGGSLPDSQGGHVRKGRGWLAQTKSFIREEEKRLILADRSANHSAEIVLPQRCPFETEVIGEPIVRIDNVIAEVIE